MVQHTHNKRYMAQVFKGTLDKTPGGLTKKDIKVVTDKNGNKHYVSKKRSKNTKKQLGEWLNAVKQAKKNLGIGPNEFVLLKKTSKLYKEAARLYYI